MPLSSTYLFKDLSASQLRRLNGAASVIEVSEGHYVFQEGNSADQVYVLESGSVEMLTKVNDDFELPVSIIR